MNLRAAAVAGLGLLAVGCATAPTSETETSPETAADGGAPPPPPTYHAYDCENGRRLISTVQGDSMELFLVTERAQLTRQRADRGTVYSSPEMSFQVQGDAAVVRGWGNGPLRCQENFRRSAIETAIRGGADFWGSGHGPGWSVQAGPAGLLFVTDDGSRRYRLPPARPDVYRAEGRTIYHSSEDGHVLDVTFSRQTCIDPVTGERFRVEVRVQFDGSQYEGCGLALQ